MMKMKPNADALRVQSLGLTIKAKAGRNGWARLYLCDAGGKKLGASVDFRSNKRTSDYLALRLADAQPRSHIGRAIAELAALSPSVIASAEASELAFLIPPGHAASSAHASL